MITITKSGSTTLPTGTPLPVSELLKGYVEILQPATRKVSFELVDCMKPFLNNFITGPRCLD
jgi:hypothetical protein